MGRYSKYGFRGRKGFKVKMGCECSYTGVGSGVDSRVGLGKDIGKEVLREGVKLSQLKAEKIAHVRTKIGS